MEICRTKVAPHPQLLEALFAFKSKINSVFRDVLGIYEINHIAISRIDLDLRILSFSSTPAMEFNLFNSKLWQYDRSYDLDWFKKEQQSSWQSLYHQDRYDELYYLKQVKHHYPLGYSLATELENHFYVYSFASHRACPETSDLFKHNSADFYKIGQYCSDLLQNLFNNYDLPLTSG